MIPLKSPVLVHSDAGRLSIALRRSGVRSATNRLPQDLMAFLSRTSSEGEDGLVFPAFNYDFSRTRVFNVKEDPVQVGALPEWIRQSGRFERTAVPFFSFQHRGAMQVPEQDDINPFGPESGFAELLRLRGTVLLAGVGVDRLTLIHFIEEMFGPPIYRYDKSFMGKVQTPDSDFGCQVTMHVRPPIGLEYDWAKIDCHLRERGILRQVTDLPNVHAVSVEEVVDFLGSAIRKNPVFLLPEEVIERLFPGGLAKAERVRREDFEDEF